jgi:starvation-inducible DNA-binding protein
MNTKTHIVPDIGLKDDALSGVVGVLRTNLADAHVLYVKLRKYHWNVRGPQFRALHLNFEEQYTALATTIDEIAEHIVQYGAEAPGTMAEFIDLARLSEDSSMPDARGMVSNLVADHEAVIRSLRQDISTVGDTYGDVAIEDFLTGLLHGHLKDAWMLRALLEESGI